MLFLKEIMDEKLDNPVFREFYGKECHICSTTVKVIAALEEKAPQLLDILDKLNIPAKDYEDLKDAENCSPELVKQLCSYLGFTESELFENCKKSK